MKIVKTSAQKRREREHKKIIELYYKMKEENPKASNNFIYVQISNNMGCSQNRVRNVVLKDKSKQECVMDG